ncbi:MAG TPA: hypothetical protein VI299_13500 [Polyangiales bacterium]
MTRTTNRRHLLALCALLALCVFRLAAPVSAEEADGVVVLVNARNPTQTLTNAEVSKMFLGQTAFWHGVVPVKVVLRPDGSVAAKSFYETALGMTPQAFRKHWDEVQLSGRGVAPKPLATPEEVASAVASMPGGIGYALASEAWKLNHKGVKIIQLR